MQRVAIARGLIRDVKLVVADEPTGNLDERIADCVMEALMQNQRRALIVATHSLRVANMCDRVFSVESGRLVQR